MTPPSPVAEEAAKLLAALQAWAGTAGAGLPLAGDAPECRVCPVCQLLRAVRGVRPEVVEHLAGASTELVAALRAVLEADTPTAPTRRVEHIDARD
jgi:hypothetical protein